MRGPFVQLVRPLISPSMTRTRPLVGDVGALVCVRVLNGRMTEVTVSFWGEQITLPVTSVAHCPIRTVSRAVLEQWLAA